MKLLSHFDRSGQASPLPSLRVRQQGRWKRWQKWAIGLFSVAAVIVILKLGFQYMHQIQALLDAH